LLHPDLLATVDLSERSNAPGGFHSQKRTAEVDFAPTNAAFAAMPS